MFRFFRINYQSHTTVSVTRTFALDYIQMHHSFGNNITGDLICDNTNRYLFIHTELKVRTAEAGTDLTMHTRVYPLKWYMIPLMPFIKTYMHRKQVSDLLYLKEQMENVIENA